VSLAYAPEPEPTEPNDGPDAETPANDAQGPAILQAVGVQNLAPHLKAEVLAQMGAKVCDEFKIDEESRKAEGWDERDTTRR
jgi:hypothetical protein